jgi:hypothetical protein
MLKVSLLMISPYVVAELCVVWLNQARCIFSSGTHSTAKLCDISRRPRVASDKFC